MKLAKKILVAMLALALLTSAFLFNATATDTFNAPGMNDIEDIYEYYTLEDYLADNYNDGTWTTELMETDSDYSQSNIDKNGYQLINVSTTQDPTNPDNGVLGVKLPYNKKSGYTMELAKDERAQGLTDKLFLAFKIYFDESVTNNFFYELKVGTVNEAGKASSSQFTILQFNFSLNNGDTGFYYSAWNSATQSFASTLTKIEGKTPETGKWYDVVIAVNAVDDVYSFDIKDLEGNAIVSSGDLSLEGAKALWGFNCYGKFLNTKGTTAEKNETKKKAAQFYLDDMEIYEGSFLRYPSHKDSVTTTHLQDLDALYNAPGTDYETKLRIASVLDYLYNEAEDFAVAAAMPNAYKYINETYAQAFKTAADAINPNANYYDRVDYLAVIDAYNSKLPAPEALSGAPGITAELEAIIIAARKAYSDEVASLAIFKEQSSAFVDFMNAFDNTNKDYAYITKYLADANQDIYAERIITYEGVVEANAILDALTAKVALMNADINAFVAAVDAMEASTTFGTLFQAYLDATASYTKYGTVAVINPELDNATAPGLADKIAYYETKVVDVLATAAICDNFNRIVKEATISSYYTSLVKEITEATEVRAQFGAYEMDYPGIADSVATYEAFKLAIDASENAVQAYITAVNAIATKTTFAEKKAAVIAATALKAAGDVLGAEGVVEANITLTAAEAEINFLEGSSTTLISLVEQIKAAKTLAEKRALILLANVSAANAEDTYTGVSAAKADLAAEIAAFEAAVAAANGALDAALKSAQALVYSVG